MIAFSPKMHLHLNSVLTEGEKYDTEFGRCIGIAKGGFRKLSKVIRKIENALRK